MRRGAACLAALCLAASAQAGERLVGAGLGLKRNALTSAGEVAAGPGAKLNGAVAESAVSTFSGAGFRLYSGLMHLAAVPGAVTSLTAVSKTTGTLELAWTAPGLDGFAGAVASGRYRIDASSDPAHRFDPSVYVAELATSVVPGTPQGHVLSGLEPNTTYYAKVYLADERQVSAEDSAASAGSTLARLAELPVLSGVYPSSVTFAWALPAGGATGFRLDASSGAFGSGGEVLTRGGGPSAVTLTIDGLSPDTVYFFRLGSLNWPGDVNFDAMVATRTRAGPPLPVEGLALWPDARSRTLRLTWSNRLSSESEGVLVVVSTNPIAAEPVGGLAYAPGDLLSDGSVLGSTGPADSYQASDLELDATRYFRLYAGDTSRSYSVAVATHAVLDLPPMSPGGLRAALAPDRASVSLTWSGVASNLDGSPFKQPAAPLAWELDRFEVYRATGLVDASWTLIGTAPASARQFTAAVPDQDEHYYYKVAALDAFGPLVDEAMAVDTVDGLFVVAPDQVSSLRIPPELSGSLRAEAWARFGDDVVVRSVERPADLGGRVVKSVRFEPVLARTNAPAVGFGFPEGQVEVTLRYETSGGLVVPSAGPRGARAGGSSPAALQPLSPAVPAADATRGLAAYWDNGREYVKLFGRVDPGDQTVSLKTSMAGSYQIRSVLRETAFDFDASGTFNKTITPNGDGLNDAAVFVFDNPKDSAVRGTIFDLRGGRVAEMRSGPVANSLQWDGKANGGAVPRGVYLYQIRAEGRAFSGTVLVVR
ncbi:MAG: gliding motility-associated C-terminal domain-containing protein [Elusimicrobia bacterium]|nr:gliding motility-associated C-terminal domain-containing protein [Elusimicrobiota bacterium]